MEHSSAFDEWLVEYAKLSEELAPLLARYATGGTNSDRKAMLVASLSEEYRQQLIDANDSKPSAVRIEQLVNMDPRFKDFIEETEAARQALFELSAKRHAVVFNIRRAAREAETGADQIPINHD